jgi:hypothetical protein
MTYQNLSTRGKRNNVHLFRYQGFMEFLNHVKTAKVTALTEDATRTGESAWYGTHDLEEAYDLAITGLPSMEKEIKRYEDSVTVNLGRVESFTYSNYDVSGDDVDVSRYIDGVPENMIAYHTEERKGGKIISLLVQGAYLADVPVSLVMRRGAAILALCNLLENAGYRLEINYMAASHSPLGNELAVIFPVKKSDELLDVARLAYCFCHPSMFRRLVFRFRETLPERIMDAVGVKSGGGMNTSDRSAEVIESDVFIPASSIYEFNTDPAAREWIVKTVESLELEVH